MAQSLAHVHAQNDGKYWGFLQPWGTLRYSMELKNEVFGLEYSRYTHSDYVRTRGISVATAICLMVGA